MAQSRVNRRRLPNRPNTTYLPTYLCMARLESCYVVDRLHAAATHSVLPWSLKSCGNWLATSVSTALPATHKMASLRAVRTACHTVLRPPPLPFFFIPIALISLASLLSCYLTTQLLVAMDAEAAPLHRLPLVCGIIKVRPTSPRHPAHPIFHFPAALLLVSATVAANIWKQATNYPATQWLCLRFASHITGSIAHSILHSLLACVVFSLPSSSLQQSLFLAQDRFYIFEPYSFIATSYNALSPLSLNSLQIAR